MAYTEYLEDGHYICIEDFIIIDKESDNVFIDYEGELIELRIKDLNKKIFKQSYKEILIRHHEEIVMLEVEGKGSDLKYVIFDTIRENRCKKPTQSLMYLDFFSKSSNSIYSELELESSIYSEIELSYIIVKEIIREKLKDDEVFNNLK